jgi:hypothetical protein
MWQGVCMSLRSTYLGTVHTRFPLLGGAFPLCCLKLFREYASSLFASIPQSDHVLQHSTRFVDYPDHSSILSTIAHLGFAPEISGERLPSCPYVIVIVGALSIDGLGHSGNHTVPSLPCRDNFFVYSSLIPELSSFLFHA